MAFTKNSIWQTIDGRQIKFKDLKNDHLNNIVHYLITRGETDGALYHALFRSALKRGMNIVDLGKTSLPYSNYDEEPYILRDCIKAAIKKGKRKRKYENHLPSM